MGESEEEARMAALRVGLMGCGSIAGTVHLPILAGLPEAEVVALAEPDPERRAAAGRRVPGAALFAEYAELLRRSDVEAVVICLPTAAHAEAAIAAFRSGKHVYLEKPLATDLSAARAVIDAWEQAGLTGMIGFNYRFNPLYQETRRQIMSGRLGGLVSARSVFATAARELPEWKRARSSGGGVMLDLASHHVDLLRFLFGQELRSVSAGLRSQRSENDSAALQLTLADGLLVQSFFSLCAVEEDRFEIYGQAGKLTVDRYLSLHVAIRDPFLRAARRKQWGQAVHAALRSPYALQRARAVGREPSYQAALAHFVAAARSGRPASPDLCDGYRSLAAVVAAEEAAATGRSVAVPDLERVGALDVPAGRWPSDPGSVI